MSKKSRVIGGIAAGVALPVLVLGTLFAANPDSGTISEGQKELSFTAGPYPVANTSGLLGDYTCDDTNPCDTIALTVELSQAYLDAHLKDRIRIVVTPDAPVDDVDLQLRAEDGELLDNSRNGPGAEDQIVFRPSGGVAHYTIETMGGTPASGAHVTVTLYTDPNAPDTPPTTVSDTNAPASDGTPGLEFSASVVVDLQRSENEPLITVDGDGNVYVCGIASTSRSAEFIGLSLDGGDQFHLLGEPPRGQVSAGGGGDCGMATAPVKNAEGFYNFAEAGLGPLTSFNTGISKDLGKTFSAVPYSTQIPAVDRQWLAFSDENTVFMIYNELFTADEGGSSGTVVQKSTDAGLSYGLRQIVTPNGGRVGPIRALPAALNPAHNGKPALYYAVTMGNNVLLATSLDNGDTWNNCTAATMDSEPAAYFPVADHDRDGNLYIGFITLKSFNAWIVAAPNSALLGCTGGTAGGEAFNVNPGFGAPVRANRDGVETVVYPWLTAGGEPGRAAISFYGSPVKKDVNDPEAKHTWHVYVSQSLDLLSAHPHVQQVRASTHPMHYDSVCLSGLACDTTNPGDRSLGDFFAMATNPRTGEMVLTYMNSSKRPGDTGGLHDTAYVVRQIAGPSLLGGEVARNGRSVLRNDTVDATGDALADFSSLGAPAATRVNVPAMDLISASIGPALDLDTGGALAGGGFTITIRAADLSDAALQSALSTVPAQSLLWVFRYTDGFRYSAASARWNPAEGFTFGHNGYVGSRTECDSVMEVDSGGGCLYYPGTTALKGKVDQASGVIQITVPLALIQALDGQGSATTQPQEVAAKAGDRMFDAAVYSQANQTSPRQEVQTYLIPLDNTPAQDFLIPGGTASGGGDTGRGGGGGGALGLALLLPLLGVALARRRR